MAAAGLLRVTPAAIELAGVAPGEERTVPVTLKNLDKRVHTVRVRGPKSKCFSVSGFQQSQKLPPGLETTFYVHIHGSQFGSVSDLAADRLVIQSESGDIEVPIRATVPRADICIEGDLQFGLVPVECKQSKVFQIINKGTAVGNWRLDWDKSTGLSLSPLSGELVGGASVDVTATWLISDPGVVSGDITLVTSEPASANGVPGTPPGGSPTPGEAKKISYAATAVKQAFEMLDVSNSRLTEVDFGTLYFGETAKRTYTLFNNGPAPAKYILSYGNAAEIKARADDDGSGMSSQQDPDDPYADLIAATHQRIRSKATNDNPFSVGPLSGVIQPYSKIAVEVSFTPQSVPSKKGFQTTRKPSDATTRIFDFMVLVDFPGSAPSARIKVPLKGKGCSARLAADTQSLAFGDLPCYEHGDHLVTLRNTSEHLPLRFSADKCPPYYSVTPATGVVYGAQTFQVLVRYKPQALGKHPSEIRIRVYREKSDVLVQELALQVSGSSMYGVGPKGQLVGGTDKLPTDFVKAPKFVSDDQAALSPIRATHQKPHQPFWEREDLVQAFEDIGHGTQLAMGKDDVAKVKKHKDKYTEAMRAGRTERLRKQRNKGQDESDVNLGLDTRSGLTDPVPRIPKKHEPLWTLASREEAQPKQQRTVSAQELAAITALHKDRPSNDNEALICTRELTKEQITKLLVGPKVVDFGKISVGSSATQYLMFHNSLDAPLHMVLDLKAVPELRGSKNTAQVVPPGARAKFPLLFTAGDVKSIHEKVDYCVNGHHVFSFGVSANVVPVTVELSAEEVHFEYALDNWDNHLERMVQVSNPHNFPVEFSLACSDTQAFTVTPTEGTIKPQSCVELLIRWNLPPELSAPPPPPPKKTPGADKAPPPPPPPLPSGVQTAVLVINLLGGDQPRRVSLQGQIPDVNLRLKDKAIDAGCVPLLTAQTVTAQIRNAGTRTAAFRVLPNPRLQITPDKSRVAPDELIDLQITYSIPTPGLLSTMIEIQIQGGRTLKLPFKAEGIVPVVEVKEASFDFGQIYIGSFAKLPFTIVNTTPVPAQLMIDLLRVPELQLTIAKEAWSSNEYDDCPLQKIGAFGDVQNGGGSRRWSSASGSNRSSRRSSSVNAMGFTGATGYKFTINVNPSKSLELQLVYKAHSAGPQNWDLTLTNMLGADTQPVVRVCTAEGVKPRILLNKTSLDFGTEPVIRSNQIKPPYRQGLTFTNPEDQPVKVTLGPLTGPGATAFDLEDKTLTLQPGDMVSTSVQFLPRDGKVFEGTLPVYLDDDLDTPYINVEVVGAGQHPRLTFDVRECLLPPVPLGVRSRATFNIVNVHYDNLELRYRLPADESHMPLQLEFPEGNLIGVARERLPVVVSFESNRPVSFTALIDFIDEDGKRYSIPVSACADNSLLTVNPFLKINKECVIVESDGPDAPLCLKTGPGAPQYTLPEPQEALGPSSPVYSIVKYLNAASGRGPYDKQLHGQLLSSRGRLLTELVEMMSGKTLPGKVAKLSSNRKDAAEQLLGAYDAALTFLRAHGALLNAVKPEMLLEEEDYQRVMTARMTRAEDDPEALEALGLWDDVGTNFEVVSVQAWNNVIVQMYKVFVLGRVNIKALKALPGLQTDSSNASTSGGASLASASDHELLLHPPGSSIVNSNVYSVAEGCLLAWLTHHYVREFGPKAKRISNFDEDLRDGLAIFSAMSGYWPSCALKKPMLRTGGGLSPADCAENAEVIIRLLSDLGLPYEITAQELYEPDGKEMLVFVLYLFQTLPQFLPRAPLEFNCKLGEAQVKDIELTNPSRKAIAYTARLEGHSDFSVDATVVRIDAGGTARLPCKCTPTTSVPQEARLVLMSKRDGAGAHAATLVFHLRSRVNTRAPLKRVRMEGPLYELQQFEFTITNPFKTDCDFMITLLHEQAEPPAPPSDDKKQKKRDGASGAAQAKKGSGQSAAGGNGSKPAAAEMFPAAFGLDRSRIRLKGNASDKIRASFLPFMGTHYCTVVCKDKEQGEFVYELVGEALLPAPLMEFRGVVPLEGPNHTYDMCIPLANSQFENAKRTFLEKHPLAKDRHMAGLLKADPFKGMSEAQYTVSQTSSLMWCPDSVTLSAAATPPVPVNKGGPPPGRKEDPAPPGLLRVALKPIGTGLYPSRILLTHTGGLDTRVIDLELTAQTLTQQFDLVFECAARQSITQEIPLVNASDQYMVVNASLSGPSKAFSGGREISVPPSSTASYQLSFKPTVPGDHSATLELSIPSTGEKNTYRLTGRAAEPVAESHIVLECQARTPVAKTIAVPNVVGGPAEYEVLCTLDCVAGPSTVKMTSSQGTSYKLTAAPVRSGTFVGSLSFKTADGQYVWYSLEVRASEPPSVGNINVSAQVRSMVAIQISATNPLSDPVTLWVRYSHPDCLLGPSTVTLSPSTQGPMQLQFFYSPLLPGNAKGSITLHSDELGEFWYQVNMTATPAPPLSLTPVVTQLGTSHVTRIPVSNPLDRPVTVSVDLRSDSQSFSLQPTTLRLAAHDDAVVQLQYTPSTIGSTETATVVLQSADMGTTEYRIQGQGKAPDVLPPVTLSVAPGHTNKGSLTWRNPFSHGAHVSVRLTGEAAEGGLVALSGTGATHNTWEKEVSASGTLQIPLTYRAPPSGQPVQAEAHVTLQPPVTDETSTTSTANAQHSPDEPLTWRMPVMIVTDDDAVVNTGATFNVQCRASDCVEERIEVVLQGLRSVASDGETFRHELVIPPHLAADVTPATLSVTPLGGGPLRLSHPAQPLVFVVRFSPQCALEGSVGLVVSKPSGGRWRFEIQLKSTEPETTGQLTIEAAKDTVSYMPVPLYSATGEPQPFTAWLSTDTPLSFDVHPTRGTLSVRPLTEQSLDPRSSRSPQRMRRASGRTAAELGTLCVSYRCIEFDKVVKGRLYVQTPDAQYSFELIGRMPSYVPPKPSDFRPSVDTRLAPEIAARLSSAAPQSSQTAKRNHLVNNIRNTRTRGHQY